MMWLVPLMIVRFIPAPAGNGGSLRALAYQAAVHPRACGERLLLFPSLFGQCGSSPRLRGTGSLSRPFFSSSRFIPAPAGNGRRLSSCRCLNTVHPRACGERVFSSSHRRCSAGSSPRLRGTDRKDYYTENHGRFIPAPAGNGIFDVKAGNSNAVHPRACGERRILHRLSCLAVGSSPRLRGTGCPAHQGGSCVRFIPAPAGNGAASM